ncbi:MAG TPA: protein phosphatase 2C domain-containing protein [Streptosporangiaceae bacterium]
MTRFGHGAATSTGRVRQFNEDSYLARPPLYAIADGMGGHAAGDLASALAIETLTECAREGPLSVPAVLAALEAADQAIARHEPAGMGTTVTGLASLETAGDHHLMVFNVGDSRVYRFAGGHLDQVTVDHSEVQELVRAGKLTRDQARTHPRRNVITRALGSGRPLRADHWLLPAIAGDRYLLCSDGLSGELPDDLILPLLAGAGPQQAATALVDAANDAGGRDNITVIVVDVADDDLGDIPRTLPPPVNSPR